MEQVPLLVSCKPLKAGFTELENIYISSNIFTLGRGIDNDVIIPFPSISRNHCVFRKINTGEWLIEDNSTFDIQINGHKIGKGSTSKLSHEDIISFEPCVEFVYKFINKAEEHFEVPNKRRKVEKTLSDNNIVNNMKIKFAESQNFELQHIEDKIQNTKVMQNKSKVLKDQLQLNMNRKIHELESIFGEQIESLKGEEELQKLLNEKKNVQLTLIKREMEEKITKLEEQIRKHNETESKLLLENNLLNAKLLKEKEEFLDELKRESSSKQEMLEKLEAKIRDQEEIRLKEKQELEEILRKETEELRKAKEKELKKKEEEIVQCETKLKQECDHIKENLQKLLKQTDEQKCKVEQELNRKKEEIKTLKDSEKVKMEQMIQEREAMQLKLSEAQETAVKCLEDLKAKNHLQNVENEPFQQNLADLGLTSEASAKQDTLHEFGQLMESELQCSICAELFVEATTLNCSHTYCKYCITKWKKSKNECPICRTRIDTTCKSLALDSFINRMIANLTEEIKNKRKELLKTRQEHTSESIQESRQENNRGNTSDDVSDISSEETDEEADSEEESENSGIGFDEYEQATSSSSSDSVIDNEFDFNIFDFGNIFSRIQRTVPGLPGAYYGGYGFCFKCGCRGHWASGCPY